MITTCISAIATGLLLCACASQEQKIAAASEIKTSNDQFLPYREYKSGLIDADPATAAAPGKVSQAP